MNNVDLHSLTAIQAGAALREGSLSATEYVQACLARIRQTEPQVGAWIHLDEEYALRQAKTLDEHRASGRPLGRLHGLPVGLKDIIDTDDMPTEDGTVLHAGRQPVSDATLVARLRAAGAVIMGKTVTAELASMHPGKTRNPWNPEHTPGGSSSGSAAAVAAGMVPLAVGTQTNGSVIRPAAFCGVHGFKPSFGLISRHGVLQQSPSLDQMGVFARSVEDIALISDVLIAHDPHDPATRPGAHPRLGEVMRDDPPLPPRLAFLGTPIFEEASQDCRDGFAELCDALGETITELSLSDTYRKAWEFHRTIQLSELSHHYRADYERGSDRLSLALRENFERGRQTPAHEYLAALAARQPLYEGIERTLEEYDAFITPAAHGAAPASLETTGNPAFCTLWTLFGMPAINLPLLRDGQGMPIGVQLVGRRGDDARLLRTARWLVSRLAQGEH
jgi:Asp-tRNA(Asn)/Glu-tRNA(Gln) amidotransferase A subunit family amidase